MKFNSIAAAIFLLFASTSLNAQDKQNVKFGKISIEDFVLPAGTDTTHGAVVIFDIGESVFEGNTKGSISLVFKRFTRIKIIDKNGFNAANGEISLYTNGSGKEKVLQLKGYTYNIEGGKVVQTKLSDESIFADKINKKLLEKKFTMPAVKEGSIIEYTYTTTSDFWFELQPWSFQGEYPRLRSEYTVGIPEFLNFVFLTQGYLKFDINEQSQKYRTYSITENNGAAASGRFSISASEFQTHWVIKNVPSLKEEKFTSSLRNHIARVQFQCAGVSTIKEKAEKIYAYVRDNFTCTQHNGTLLTMPIKQVFAKKNGNVADINLLLTAMLIHEGIDAKPVLLSTREHGFSNEIYPLIGLFNYVIAAVKIAEKRYYLDASHTYLGFNKIPSNCYNGHARIVHSQLPEAIYFMPDSLIERKTTSVFIAPDEKDSKKLNGNFQTQLGFNESVALREELKSKGMEAFFKKMKSAYGFDVDIQEPKVDSMKKKEDPLFFSYNFLLDAPEGGIMYINPMMAEGIKENYFKAAERFYPVEMPYAFDETYVFNFQIPNGYAVDEIPKSTKVSFNESDGSFDYLIDQADGVVRLRSRIKLNKATFASDEYQSLRDFFGFIVKKHAEQIVLKKKVNP